MFICWLFGHRYKIVVMDIIKKGEFTTYLTAYLICKRCGYTKMVTFQ